MVKKIVFKLFFFLFLILPVCYIKADDLTQYFSIDDVLFCSDSTCETRYDENNAIKAEDNFLMKISWSLTSENPIKAGDEVVFPLANQGETDTTSSFSGGSFSWTDIYDNSKKIGRWKISGNTINRKIYIEFSDDAVGEFSVSGMFTTPATMHTSYTYKDRVIPITIGSSSTIGPIEKSLKVKTYSLKESGPSPSVYYSSSTNDSVEIRAISPKNTIKQLYELYNNNNFQFKSDAIIGDLFYELFLPAELNLKEIDRISIQALYAYPTDLEEHKVSENFPRLNVTSFFLKVEPYENENYDHFKNRLEPQQYGIYKEDNNTTLVINYGKQPSQLLTYKQAIENISDSFSEPGDYSHSQKPFTIDNDTKVLLNAIVGSNNVIEGKVVSFGSSVNLNFQKVTEETIKQVIGAWSWKDASGKIYDKHIDVYVKLVVPDSIVVVNGVSQLLLRDFDSKNEIPGATIKLYKIDGENEVYIGKQTTDASGMLRFNDLESGTYKYVQEDYLDHYKDNSFKMYSDESMSQEILTFDYNSSEGNVIYATNEKEKFTVSYNPGDHGAFDTQTYNNLSYGTVTPNYEPDGADGWIFKEWDPEKDVFVTRDRTYTALWKKMVKVTTKYLEIGTDKELSPQIEDIDENDTNYTTTKKEIENYEFVRIDGLESGNRGKSDITVTYYYKKKEANLNIKFLDCATNQQLTSITERLYYGDEYDADDYEATAQIPLNYNRIAAYKSDNYKGIIGSDKIDVSYCYNKKDSVINSEIIKSGTDKITTSQDSVFYRIDYNTLFTNYIGGARIIVVDNLPSKIDVANSSLDGGVYDENSNTIVWTVDINIDSYNNPSYNLTKNIELFYTDIDIKEDVLTNNVVGSTIISDKSTYVETNYNSYIDVRGTINVNYIESKTNNKLVDSIITTDKVGKKYEIEKKEIEGYKLVDSPKEKIYEYKEQSQNLDFIYERIKLKIVTSAGEGGTITGDEEVYYGEDSSVDNINIKAEDGYYISNVNINDKDVVIPEKQTNLTIPNFEKMKEDKYIRVSFTKKSNILSVPNTLKKISIILISFGIIAILISIVIIIKNKDKIRVK